MANEMTILVGTVGQGVMRSADGGETWRRVGIDQGIHSDAIIRNLISHPNQLEIVFAGTDRGLLRSDNAGQNWKLVDSPLSDYCVWSLAIDPVEPECHVRRNGHAISRRNLSFQRRRTELGATARGGGEGMPSCRSSKGHGNRY